MHDREFGAHCGFRTDHAVNLYTSPGMTKVVVVGWQIRATEIVHIPTVRILQKTQMVYSANIFREFSQKVMTSEI